MTEKEIYKGIIDAKNIKNNVLYFQRDIEDIDDNLIQNLSQIKRYVELDKNNKIDSSVKSLLDDLKYKDIPSKLTESNIFRFNVKWNQEAGICLKTHKDYIETFGETFYEQVKKLIDQNQQLKPKFVQLNDQDIKLYVEVADHASFCNKTVDKFHGRDDILVKVK